MADQKQGARRGAAVFLVIFVLVSGLGFVLLHEGLAVAANAAQVVSLAPLAVVIYRWPRSPGPAPLAAADIGRAKDVLAGMVAEQWRREAGGQVP